jgi:hypothetical protein
MLGAGGANKGKESSWPFPGLLFRPSFLYPSPPPLFSGAYINHLLFISPPHSGSNFTTTTAPYLDLSLRTILIRAAVLFRAAATWFSLRTNNLSRSLRYIYALICIWQFSWTARMWKMGRCVISKRQLSNTNLCSAVSQPLPQRGEKPATSQRQLYAWNLRHECGWEIGLG